MNRSSGAISQACRARAADILSCEDVCTECTDTWLRHLQLLSCAMCWLLKAPDKSFLYTLNSLGRWSWLTCSFPNTQAATLLEFLVPLLNFFVRRWFCVVLGPKPSLHCHNWLSFDKFKTQNAFLFPVLAMFHHDCPLAVKPASMPWCLLQKTWRDSLPIDMLLSAVSVLIVAIPSSEVPERRMNYPV
jgi:hypothetical protein